MSDDWVSKYISGVYNRRQQERKDTQTRRRFAETGANAMFTKIEERVAHDVHSLRLTPAFQPLEVGHSAGPWGFHVTYRSSPWVELRVALDTILVSYTYTFRPKDGKRYPKEESGTLRICSDLDGILTVYKNGDKEAFADESEISEFLLKPILEHVSVE